MSRARLAKVLLSVLVAATAGVIVRSGRRDQSTATASRPGPASGGGANQGSDKAEKSKRAVSDYVVVGGLVVSIATLAFNQWHTSQELGNAQQQIQLSQQGQFSERYAHAIEQLGSENPPSRLTGIYELEQVARASPEHYQLGMEILADYLRIFSPVTGAAGTPGPPAPPNAAQATEIRAILKVLGRRNKDLAPRQLDLSGVNLQGLDLRGENLSGDDFSRTDFVGADLAGANLTGATLFRANLTEAGLFRANLTEAGLFRANLTEAHLFRANLTEAGLRRADLTEANLARADLTEANLARADLTEANLEAADLTEANLEAADLTEALNLTQSQLDVAILDENTTLPPELGTPEPASSPTP